MKKKLVASKNFVSKHRVALAITTTSIFWLYVISQQNTVFGEMLDNVDSALDSALAEV